MTKRADATVFLLAMALLLAGAGVGVVDACDGVTSMSREDTCRKAFGAAPSTGRQEGACATACIPPMHELCLTLTVYAVVAAKTAQWSYEASAEAAGRLLGDASLAGDERAAYEACAGRYAAARSLAMAVQGQLMECSYGSAKQELVDARVHVEACGGELWRFASSPLYAMNAADQLKATLACELTGLIVGK
uniref:Pectinesterase inhibitor domain-containing protein n=1 Tax=Oryza brachyantha TaxID=4533 RepID=J3MQA0_ORYBR